MKPGLDIRSAVLLFSLALLNGDPGAGIWAQTAPRRTEQTPASSSVRCSLSVKTHDWQLGRPAIVSVELKNGVNAPLDLSVVPILSLLSKEGSGQETAYWSPVDIVANRALETTREKQQGAVSFKPKPLNLHLDKNGTAMFDLDANHTKWDKQISSRWPALNFSEVVLPGNYVVNLDLGAEASGLRCNKVEVHISASPDRTPFRVPHDDFY